MRLNPLGWLLVGGLLATTAPSLADEAPKADDRVKDALDRLKLTYKLTERANYQITFNTKDKRTQVAFVNSSTSKYQGVEYRDITSTAYKVDGDLPAADATALLADNDKRILGQWRTVPEKDVTYVIYAVQLPATASDTELRNALDAVAVTADEMEAKKSDKDDF